MSYGQKNITLEMAVRAWETIKPWWDGLPAGNDWTSGTFKTCLVRNFQSLSPFAQEYSDQRRIHVEELASRGEDGQILINEGLVVFSDNARVDLSQRLAKLNDQRIEPWIHSLSPSELPASLTLQEVAALDFMLI